jgi:hypothetical protein
MDTTSRDIANLALAGEGSRVSDAVQDVLMDKVADALAVKKMEVSQSFLTRPTEEEELDDGA